nr:hypothetical protein [Bacteroides thetaiotaomicron]
MYSTIVSMSIVTTSTSGYIDERTFAWLEKDLSYVSRDKLVFVVMHIPPAFRKS